TLARIGDAELGLLFPCPSDGEVAGRKAQAIASQLNQPLVVDGLEAMLEVHIGLATYPLDGRTTQELQQRADVAMLAARRAQRPVAASPEADAMTVSEELLLVDQLREGIEGCQLFLEFLPKLDLRTRQVDGVEALVRWQHPERGVILAERFISIAERYGLILPLTLRVITLAAAQLRSWQDEGKDLSVAINLSVDLLQNPQFPVIFDHICTATDGRAEKLLLEISERSLAEHPTTILHVTKVLKEKGCQLSLDNFGTGSLSLPLLQRLPIVELKVDRSFVTAMARDEHAAAVVRSAMSLADSLGLQVVAVGVEDQATLDRLGELGCTQVQGHYVGAPMTAAKLQEWLATFSETEGGRLLAAPDAA
ncbi:MAG: GGDEF domain-containing phosphodiesterase, partial [Nitrospirota bacterium]|nr:GGDEF domain-containing phosphodiesterase [Nitrospirota bacterium]